MKPWKRIWNRENARWLLSLGLMLLVMSSFRSAIADWNDVPTGSMQPTILIGDRIFVNKLAYDLKIPFTRTRLATWGHPQRGDIVVCWSPADGARLVKRVVAVPGDVIQMAGNVVQINGRTLDYTPLSGIDAAPEMGEDAAGMEFFNEDIFGMEHMVAIQPSRRSQKDFGPVKVPDGKYFMMGDNRDNSADSRYFGFVDRSAVSGRTRNVVLSLDYEDHYVPRWSRFLSRLI
ncbi:MAG: signal peptidase I [Gemmatimonadales bacterium]|nr:signal peptidase I [Gemmatimonadales bacterium]